MKKPAVVTPVDEVTTVAHIFDTRLVVKGWTWLPVFEVLTWGFMAWLVGRHAPPRTLRQRLGLGALLMPIVLGSEWLHNLAHAAAACLIHKPIDAIRIVWGTPLLVYFDIQDEQVMPRQHIARASGGPIFNLALLTIALLGRSRTRSNTAAREIADAAVGVNALIVGAGLLPIPALDGGAILKWSLVESGRTREDADEIVRRVNGPLSGLLMGGAVALFATGRRWQAAILGLLAATALAIWRGWLKEQ